MRLAPFHERLLHAVLPVFDRYGLVLAGGHAMRAHRFTDRPNADLDLATTAEVPPVAEGVRAAFRAAGLRASVIEVTPRTGRLTVEDAGESCPVDLMREVFRRPPVRCGIVPVPSVEDTIGLTMRALHDRGHARDIIDVASVAHLYAFRELEGLGRAHDDGFEPYELASRLECAEFIGDDEFLAHGVDPRRIAEIRGFARAWVEDIKLRRVDDGDADLDDPDLPDID
ncbi:hypothetical protein E1295_07610 [Nonomuraea mesophila]|uniref:Nucleotidyl transferase AbiEii/AbiGii toxin family protein n=1 Tax=Nonomuraea mesophila TaxID=2530382 RepID=A0A4V2ZBI7_9ACTN|nr:hypothetical protein E1295_07610 [Nonomuraea mesophila]